MKILLACDGSEHSEAAISETLRSPCSDSTTFQILSVVDTSFSPPPTVQRMLAEAQKVVDSAVEKFKERLPATTNVIGTVTQETKNQKFCSAQKGGPTCLLSAHEAAGTQKTDDGRGFTLSGRCRFVLSARGSQSPTCKGRRDKGLPRS